MHFSNSVRNSCSQNRRTRMPCCSSSLVVFLSLSRFRLILSLQKLSFIRGKSPHCGHPCQKHPSTKIATLSAGKKKSGFPLIRCGRTFHPHIADLTKPKRNRRSVVRLSFPRTACIALDRSRLVPLNPLGKWAFNARSIAQIPSS